MEKLAIFGGAKKVTIPMPHFNWPVTTAEEIKAVDDYMRGNKLSEYGYPAIVEEFENRFRRYHKTGYALALNSGTSCLHAAYYALGIKHGDEVIVPDFTFPATATPLFVLGAAPVLCDCTLDTANIDPADIKRKITKKTKAIAVTHLWGHPCEMDEIMDIAEKHKLPVLEDCSHAHGAKYKGRLVGTFGAVSCFSCDSQKMMASGEAGIMITNSKRIFEKALIFTDFGSRLNLHISLPEFAKFKQTGLGLKYRIHPLAAVIANEKLKILDRMNAERADTLNYFSGCLSGTKSIVPPVTKSCVSRGGFYGYKPIYKNEKLNSLGIESFIKILQAEGVDIRKSVTPPLHNTELFCRCRKSKVKYKNNDFPNSAWFFNNHLSFPTFSSNASRPVIDEYMQAIHKVENIISSRPEIITDIKKIYG